MAQFRYEAKKGTDPATTGIVEAQSERAAAARLREMGYVPISVEPHSEETRKDVLRHALRRIRLAERNLFFRQLATLIESGMTITRALGTIRQQCPNPKLAAIVDRLNEDVQRGNSFADALEAHPRLFPAVYSSLVRAGETGGALEEVLWRIVGFGEQEEELRGKAVAAMVYPAFLLVIGSAAIFILLSFVFPRFVAIFEDFEASLPWPTEVMMAVCAFMGRFWWAVLLTVAIAIVGLVLYRKSRPGRKQYHSLLLRLPAVGAVILKHEMAGFARTLGTLLDNGVPVLQALRITTTTVANSVIAGEVDKARNQVAEGLSLSESLQDAVHFPPMVVNMFAVGEESGRLGAVSKRIADTYDTEVDRAVKILTALLEPLLIVIMGVIIGFMVIAMLLPMLTLSAHVG